MRYVFITLFLCTNIVLGFTQDQKIRIACVGNSITYGSTVINREKNAYPMQLQALLGDQFQVKNFGVSGATLLKKGNKPYWNESAYKEALAYKPNVVIIKLGTNDSKLINRPFYGEFEENYKELIESFKKQNAKARIILLLPLPSFAEDSNSIYEPIIKQEIIPFTKEVAFQTKAELIDLHSLFIDREDLFSDKIHPTSLGATLIAKRLYETITLKEVSNKNIFNYIKEDKTISSFHGFECADFTFNGRACKIVKPKKAADGLPWIWRARFWGHEPQTDVALLERGFHVVYCDVAELFGNKEAISLWNNFYAYMQKFGLAKKVSLEGMSRGGMYIYNWALENPSKVSCIYADAPVLDLKSWPGGKGKSPGSPSDWEIAKKDFSLTEEEAMSAKINPVDHAQKIATLGIPMLHVVGDADDVVPIEENTTLFEKHIKEHGGDIIVIHKPGIGHHPHSLANPTPIVDFILKATGYRTTFAIIPTPGSEYRSGAGWKEGTDWWSNNDNINQLLDESKNIDIVFIGNSITQGIVGHRSNLTYSPGLAAFDSVYKKYAWECAGISGDRTQHILWRLQHGSYAKANPKLVVLTIGVNNFADDSGEEVALGIHQILDWMKVNMPNTKIVLIGPLPAGLKKDDMLRFKYEKTQSIIQQEHDAKQVFYLPLAKKFIKENGELDLTLCSGDGIHFITKGYEVWASSMAELINTILPK